MYFIVLCGAFLELKILSIFLHIIDWMHFVILCDKRLQFLQEIYYYMNRLIYNSLYCKYIDQINNFTFKKNGAMASIL